MSLYFTQEYARCPAMNPKKFSDDIDDYIMKYQEMISTRLHSNTMKQIANKYIQRRYRQFHRRGLISDESEHDWQQMLINTAKHIDSLSGCFVDQQGLSREFTKQLARIKKKNLNEEALQQEIVDQIPSFYRYLNRNMLIEELIRCIDSKLSTYFPK